MEPFVNPHKPEKMKVAHITTGIEEGNWKLVFENTVSAITAIRITLNCFVAMKRITPLRV